MKNIYFYYNQKCSILQVGEVIDVKIIMNDVGSMYAFLKSYCYEKNYNYALRALEYASIMHEGQMRKGGDPYIVHPLAIATYGILIGLDDEITISTELLHDVEEDNPDCDLNALDLPDEIKENVHILTFTRHEGREKAEDLKDYYERIKKKRCTALAKLGDRRHNLATMAGVFSPEKVIEYVKETQEFVYPVSEYAESHYPENQAQIIIFQNSICDLVTMANNNTLTLARKKITSNQSK